MQTNLFVLIAAESIALLLCACGAAAHLDACADGLLSQRSKLPDLICCCGPAHHSYPSNDLSSTGMYTPARPSKNSASAATKRSMPVTGALTCSW